MKSVVEGVKAVVMSEFDSLIFHFGFGFATGDTERKGGIFGTVASSNRMTAIVPVNLYVLDGSEMTLIECGVHFGRHQIYLFY